MNKAESYAGEIERLDNEIKRLDTRLKNLKEQRKERRNLLYNHMVKNNMDKIEKITLNSIKPRVPIKRKPEAQKKQDAIILFQEAGINDPENFYKDFKLTQKYSRDEEPPPKEKKEKKEKKKKKNDYDPFLGF